MKESLVKDQEKTKDMTSQLRNKENEIEAATSREASYKQEIEDLSTKNKALEETVKNEREASEKALGEARIQIAAKEDEVKTLQEDMKKLAAEKETVEKEWAAKVEQMEQTDKTMKGKSDELLLKMNAKIEEMKKEAIDENKKVLDLESKLKESSSKLNTSKKEVSQCKDEGQKLRRDLAEATASLKKCQEHRTQGISDEKKKQVQLEVEIEELKQEIERFEGLGERYETGDVVSKLCKSWMSEKGLRRLLALATNRMKKKSKLFKPCLKRRRETLICD